MRIAGKDAQVLRSPAAACAGQDRSVYRVPVLLSGKNLRLRQNNCIEGTGVYFAGTKADSLLQATDFNESLLYLAKIKIFNSRLQQVSALIRIEMCKI